MRLRPKASPGQGFQRLGTYVHKSLIKAFSVYSLLAKRAKAYAFLYPFTELLLGIFLLAQIKFAWAAAISLLMGLEGVVSIVNTSFLKKEKVACADVSRRWWELKGA